MNWENIDFSEEEKETSSSQNGASSENMSVEVEEKNFLQLAKFQDPITNIERQEYIAVMNRFGNLIATQSLEEIKNELLTENCLSFLFNFFPGASVIYSQGKEDFPRLYTGAEIQERKAKTTHVDIEKRTGCQISECKVMFDGATKCIDITMLEIFSFEGTRIWKYRASCGVRTSAHGGEATFELTRKDLMLAKAKEFNCALAGQPNLEKIAALLHEKTEYKIWSWDEQKCFTFHKSDLVNNFHSMEDNFTIECIVPYEVYSEVRERQYIIGTYVYHLENKTSFPGRKYIWLSTSIFSFDHNLNISQICQQGELYLEGEAPIPFEVLSREGIVQKALDLIDLLKTGIDFFYSGKVDFNFTLNRHGPIESPTTGFFQGMAEVEKLKQCVCFNHKKIDWGKVPDVYVDFSDPSYDAVFLANVSQGSMHLPSYRYRGKLINFYGMSLYLFENGKATKINQFYSDIPEMIISPFDDLDLEGINIKPLKSVIST